MATLTNTELRTLMQLETDDKPSAADMTTIITWANYKVIADIGSISTNTANYALYLWSKKCVLDGQATSALGKGFVEAVVEGRRVRFNADQLKAEAEKVAQEYERFLYNNFSNATDVGNTTFMEDVVSDETLQSIKDRMQGVNNAQNQDQTYYSNRTN